MSPARRNGDPDHAPAEPLKLHGDPLAGPAQARRSRRAGSRVRAGLTYADAGVTLEEKDRFTDGLVSLMKRTHGPRVIANPGGFAGLFRLDFNERLFKKNYKDPVLVACADGVGTKVKLAREIGRFDTVGIDLVAMNVNDMIVQGAEPLFFLDYVAVPKVESAMLTEVLKGIVEGCRQAGCALLGGETAEMPDVYAPGDFDLAGFAVGVVELKRAVSPERVEKGDVVLGLASSGVHSNGYSLVRAIVRQAGLDLGAVYPELVEAAPAPRRRARPAGAPSAEPTLGEVLLTPTRIYVTPVVRLLREYRVKKVISGMAHITGSGLAGNLERALHKKVDAEIDCSAWTPPQVFRFLQDRGSVPEAEMRRVFNMGIGYVLVVRPAFADSVARQLKRLGERVHVIGTIVRGTGRVREINLPG
ncbi:MAG TPA: phosphoribosylformylglycinamidine cyclo-ligase [Phycisphaerales bacterium]|nr:phosphoribosylformylglycinamidine cyclo-ligase [Phycisphaerales bacterium]